MANPTIVPQSRSEQILRATIDGTPYNEPAQSRIEYLLLELKEAIEAGGGGGGGTTNYNLLNNKPQINGHELIGNQTASDLEIDAEPLTQEQLNQLLANFD